MKQTHLQRVKALKQKKAIRRSRGKRRTSRPQLAPAQREARFAAFQAIGCIVCRLQGLGWVQPAVHHLRGHPWSGAGQRASDADSVPLCAPHHQTGDGKGPGQEIGYHWSPAQFEAAYGTQGELLEKTDWLIERLKDRAA